MKKLLKIISLAIAANSFSSAHADYTNQTDQAVNIGVDLLNKLGEDIFNDEDMPEYIRRIELEWDISSEGKPQYDLLTVQPLLQSDDAKHTIFTQARVAYGDDGRTTTNLGFGYRNLTMDDKLLLGINAFHDYEFPYNHQRVGGGIEIKSSAIELNSNYYNAVSDWNTAGAGFSEKALDGYDMELGMQIPYLPWARAYAKKFYYDGITHDNDTNGEIYSLRLRPLPYLEFEAGQIEDDATKSSQFLETRIRIAWGNDKNSKIPLIDNRAFRFNESVRDQTLDKVRRSNTIRKERKSNGASVTVSMTRAN